jgi:uncharacterized membrane protein YqjE
MSNAERPPAAGWKQRLQPLAAELSRMLALRRELAALEVAHDRQLLQQGGIVGGIGALLAVLGATQLVQSLAGYLASVTVLSTTAWSLIFGLLFLVPGGLLIYRVYCKIRSRFCGLQGTLAELQEDLVWLREWTGSEESPE